MTSNVASSQILEAQFGATELRILSQAPSERVICTFVSASKQVLEFSHVLFLQPGVQEYPQIHQQVLGGKSIGKAFKDNGIEFTRMTQAECKLRLSELAGQFKADGPASVVSVTILVGPAKTPYADILEVYSPAVEWRDGQDKLTPQQIDRLGLITNALAESNKSEDGFNN